MRDNREILEKLFQNEIIKIKRASIFDVNPDPMPSDFDFDRFEGMMLGLAVGDALGNTTEGMVPERRYNNFGEIRDYLPNRHADGKRVGTPSDDTQLAFWTLDQLIDDDGLVPDRLASRFCRDQIFGIGGTIQKFILNQKNGKNWTESGPQSAGNGALMRIAPVVFPHLRSGGRDLWADTAISGMLTHNDTASVSACIAFVYILWQLLKMDQPPAPEWWLNTYCAVTKDLELRTIYRPRSRAVNDFSGSLRDFAEREVLSAYHSGTPIMDACNRWYSGAYLLETVPAVLLILMKHGDDPEEAIVRAVNDTKDNDTIGAIVGAAVGALHGKENLPERWIANCLGRTSYDNDGHIFRLIEKAEKIWGSKKLPNRINLKSQENIFPAKHLSTMAIKSGKISDNCELVFCKNRVLVNIAGKTIFEDQLIEDDFFKTFENIQNELKSIKLSLKVCGQCQNFGFSSMAYQMSGGEKGYCTLVKALNVNREDVVYVLDSCDAFRHRNKETEYSPWLPA